MSGTSIDGVDAALLETDGVRLARFGPWLTLPYAADVRERIRACLGHIAADPATILALTDCHVLAVRRLLEVARMDPAAVTIAGFPGHTILHRPEQRLSVQIGDGARLARRIGIDVIADFRSRDLKAGGQGAPLAPLYHQALALNLEKPLCVLNLGGVANLTWLGPGGPIAFDVGPGNALIDDWVRSFSGEPYDRDGRLAARGRVHDDILAAFLRHPWFEKPPPKSLDRHDFDWQAAQGLSAADGARTLTEFTAAAVERAVAHLPAEPKRWLVTGGGRHNRAIMAALQHRLGATVDPVEVCGWRGDALEAEAFAYLAVRALRGLPLSVPTTTGVPSPQTGGRLIRARQTRRRPSTRPRASPLR
jgi:anhydro-N-acetylmuramic acid kinase